MADSGKNDKTRTIRAKEDMARMLQAICTFERKPDGKKISVDELIDPYLRGPITERFRQLQKRLANESSGDAEPPKPGKTKR